MLRVSFIAIVAVSLAACDDDSETAVEETEVEVAVESAEQEATEAAAEAEETAEAAADEASEEVTTLTSDSPAVETTVMTEVDDDEVASSGNEGESPSAGGSDPAAEGASSGTESAASDESEGTELAAAETEAEPTASGEESDPMQRYQEWVQGRWAASASCESGIVEMEQNALSLPGGVSCSEIEVADAGADSLAIVGSSCEGVGDLEEVDLEVTQTDDGITVARGGEEASLVRCE